MQVIAGASLFYHAGDLGDSPVHSRRELPDKDKERESHELALPVSKTTTR